MIHLKNTIIFFLKNSGQALLHQEKTAQTKEFGDYPDYKRTCKRHNAVPNNFFLRHCREAQDEIFNMNFRYLSFGDSFALAKEIEVSQSNM